MAADLIADLAAATLASSAAILLILLLRAPLRRAAGSRLVYAAWLLVPLAAAVVFLPAPPAWLSVFTREAQAVVAIAAPASSAPADWTPALMAVWAIGAAGGLTLVMVQQHRAVRRLRTEAAPGPAVVGLISPRIVLPADFEARYTPQERAMILSHEQVHLSVGDVRVNAAIVLFACLFWFNPLVLLAARLIRADQELACDEAVIARHPEARRTYAEALLKTQLSSASMPLGCYWPERSHQALKERLNMLTLKTPGKRRMVAGAALLCALGLGTGYVAWAAAPQEPQPTEDPLEVIGEAELLPDGRMWVQTTPGAAATLMTIEEQDAWLKQRYGRQAGVQSDGKGNVLVSRPRPVALTNGGGHPAEVGAAARQDRIAGFVDVPNLDRTRRIERDGDTFFRYTGPTPAVAVDRNGEPVRADVAVPLPGPAFIGIPAAKPNQGFNDGPAPGEDDTWISFNSLGWRGIPAEKTAD